ncbi:MSHA biogenesis protein MshI [Planctobacterium marinum]|uniref:MSHA biogenesis protein MshI n=1 Tax=Planctobacterium marinum TaxID=1631968 RepID=A0AA48HKJ8_9ALTE|nr:hypothetical protein MACH26_36570 [Planctobacterium marinum]
MRVGWRKLISYLNRKPSGFASLGIEYDINGLHLCATQEVDGQHTWVLNQTFPLQDWQSSLKSFVEEQQLQNTKTTLVFATKKYKLVQTDKPAVPEEELAQALQWSAKDLLMTQDEVVMDYFDLPAQTMGANKVNVVAIPKAELFDVCQGVLEAGLFIERVTVEELATCELLPKNQEGYVTVFQAPGAEVCLNIVKAGKLYFSRRIKGYEQISSFTEMELQMGVSETLSVELQRSMDFFESQLRQAPVKKIYLNLDTEHQGVLAKLIGDAMQVESEPFVPDFAKSEELQWADTSLAALGGAFSVQEVEEQTTNESGDAA